jgi:DNA polymerase-1
VIEYEVVRDAERLGPIANEVDSAQVIGLDIETTDVSPLHGDIRLVQLNTGQGTYVIDLFETGTLGPVADALASDTAVKIIQNAKFEQKWFLHKHDVELWPVFDTFRASALIHNGKHLGHNLYDLYHRELQVAPGVPDKGASDWGGALTKEQLDYAAEDVTYLHPLRDSLKPKLAKTGLNKIAVLEFGACLPEARIELNGFRLDSEKWLELARENEQKQKELRAQLDDLMPHPKGLMSLPGINPGFNLNSPVQVRESFKKLGIDLPDTTEDTMAMMATRHKAIPLFMQYRKISKRVQAFGPKYLRHIDSTTGRVHTDFWPLTGAGRYASRDPNLQQIPRIFEYRDCFRPGDGKVIIVCDYGQIELRIAAQITGDRTLREIYLRGEDAHRRTASIVAGVPVDKVTKSQRQAAKPVNFGLIYGLGAEALVIYSMSNYGVSITLSQAKQFIKRYFEGYPRIRAWQDRTLRDAERTKMARTLWGRRRFLDPKTARNEFFNTPVQGTGADGLKRSLRNVYFRLKKYEGRAKLVHMVHDEIVVECDDDPELINEVKSEIEHGMIEGIQPMLPDVPVIAEADVGPSWAAH